MAWVITQSLLEEDEKAESEEDGSEGPGKSFTFASPSKSVESTDGAADAMLDSMDEMSDLLSLSLWPPL